MAVRLGMRIGVKPTGPDGTFTRGDHLRGAGLSARVAFGLLVLMVIAVLMSGEKLDGIYAGIMVMCSLGLLMAGVSCLASLLRAAVGK